MNLPQQVLFPECQVLESKQINFVVSTKMEEDQKLYLIELDPTFERRVGDLLEAKDSRTGRRYLMMISDIEYAYTHKEEHARMLDLLRRRPDKEMDQSTFNALVDLIGRRFLIVGQTGKGKATTVRHLLDGHIRASKGKRQVGFLVEDFKMEYPFDTYNQSGQTVPGLVRKLRGIAKEKLVILTCYPHDYADARKDVKDIVKIQIPLESLSLSVFCDLANLSEAQTNVVRLVEDSGRISAKQFFSDILDKDEHGMPNTLIWGKRHGSIFYNDKGRAKARGGKEMTDEEDIDRNLRDRLSYIRRAVQRLLNMPFMTRNAQEGDCTAKLLQYLREGCTIIVDKQRLEDHQRELLTVILLYHLFRYNQQLASGDKDQRDQMIPVVVAVEEAQYLLSKDKVADPDSIFAKIAFSGRSYQIGLLAITQRPQAIQKELLGQFDGFLVLPLEHANDFRHLADACPALSGYRNDLASAPIGAEYWTAAPRRRSSLQMEDYKFETT